MSIFLLSDTQDLAPALKRKLGSEINRRGSTIAYISSSPQDVARTFLDETETDYRSFIPHAKLEYFDLSDNFSDEDLEKTLRFGTVHISGGNTYGFMDLLRKRNFKKILGKSLSNGGLVVGVSAGAIALTPHIGTTAMCGDVNSVGLDDLSGMGLVDFGFLPHLGTHYAHTPENEAMVKEVAAKTCMKVYIAADSDGLFVDGAEVQPFGNVVVVEP